MEVVNDVVNATLVTLAAAEIAPLPPAVWASVIVSGIACMGVFLCAACTPFCCSWHTPKPRAPPEPVTILKFNG